MTDKASLIRTEAVSQLSPAAWAELQQLIAAGAGASPALLRAAAASRAAIAAGVLVRPGDSAQDRPQHQDGSEHPDWSWIGAATVPTGLSHDLDDIRAASDQRGSQTPGTPP